MTIRRATDDDVDRLHAVAAATFALACPPHVTAEAIDAFVADALSAERFAQYLADPARIVLVDEEADGSFAGYTMVVLGQPSDRDVGRQLSVHPTSELSKCYALPAEHGTGRAGALLRASLDAAREAGVAGMWLGVNQHNARAQRFYAKHGFARIGARTFLVGDRYEDDFVLERAL